MQASFFESIRYAAPQKMPAKWPLPPGLYEPDVGAQTFQGSVANYRKQESLDSQVLDFPTHDFRIWPRKGNFATEPDTVGVVLEQ